MLNFPVPRFRALHALACLILFAAVSADFADRPYFAYSEPDAAEFYETATFEAEDSEEEDDEDSGEPATSGKVIPRSKEVNVHAVTLAPLDPEAEMLPASYTGVKPPGVDHMELRLAERKEDFKGYPQKLAALPQKKAKQTKKSGGGASQCYEC